MEPQDEVHEVSVHAISLRAPRNKRRSGTSSPAKQDRRAQGLAAVRRTITLVLEPPHQGWLAVLGFSSLVLRNTSVAWRALVREGTKVEADISRRVSTAARSVWSSTGSSDTAAAGSGQTEAR
jgi:hypothetical protein